MPSMPDGTVFAFAFVFVFAFILKNASNYLLNTQKKAYVLYQSSSNALNFPFPTPRWAPKEFQLVCNLQITTFDWLLIMRKIPTDQNSQRALSMDWRVDARGVYFISFFKAFFNHHRLLISAHSSRWCGPKGVAVGE